MATLWRKSPSSLLLSHASAFARRRSFHPVRILCEYGLLCTCVTVMLCWFRAWGGVLGSAQVELLICSLRENIQYICSPRGTYTVTLCTSSQVPWYSAERWHIEHRLRICDGTHKGCISGWGIGFFAINGTTALYVWRAFLALWASKEGGSFNSCLSGVLRSTGSV